MRTAERAPTPPTPPLGSEDHACPWREEVRRLRSVIEALQGELDALKRQHFGQKSEKMPSIADALRRNGSLPPNPQAARQQRQHNKDRQKDLPTRTIPHAVPKEKQVCPCCHSDAFKPLGPGKTTVIFEYIPMQMERQVHVRQTLVCPCGQTILTAPGPIKVFPKGLYGPRFIAHLIVSKCADAMGLNRLAQQFRRQGIPLSRSTLVDLFQRSGQRLQPLGDLLLKEIAKSDVVQGDATTLQVQAKGKTRRACLWTFLDPLKKLIGYRFSLSRNRQTACQVLGHSQGAFVGDADKAFNDICQPGSRRRGGCMAHARRKFFEARSVTPLAQQALDFILPLYAVEYEAKTAGIAGTPEHLDLRQRKSRPVMDQFHVWLQTQQPLHTPKSLLGKAITYALNQWEPLGLFLTDARIPIDNNLSERVLRIVAQGRKNFLFVGNEQAGHHLATLYSLVMTAIAHGLNPEDYLADVLIRIQTLPVGQLHELLPQNWKPSSPQPKIPDSS